MAELPAGRKATMKAHVGGVLAVRFNKDGAYCLTCGQDRVLKLWNPYKEACIKSYLGHGHEVYDVAVADDNSRLASCGGDKMVFYWDVASGNIIRKFRGHELKVNAVSFAASYDKTVRIYDCRHVRKLRRFLSERNSHGRSRSLDAIQTMSDFTDSVTSLAVREHEICTGCVDGWIRIYDIRHGEMISDCVGEAVTCVRFTYDGNCVLCTCMDNKVRLFDKSNGELLNTYTGHKNDSYKVEACMTRGDSHVVCGSEKGDIFFWDLVSGKEVHKLSGHSNVVCSLAYHPSDTYLLSASVDGTVSLWQ
ncbi:hypothetical protein GUITHDRAFT_140239 [Guillardia theta CCMP2712]|uniref:Uncharacterized protein n=1 Tax=Guillardia theta (strain CCMP2712) TaxID=905079 RepID=L1J5J8_GUITC|nr:hypothetical protein GUITHDRAFT_140239 [Guillardia theta CCMP2712]EKX43798.1 hypothetical protein GUITHDRAFT_140239 [Guillardia theta CCMP2712]|eukprot:XP_005830778.1 hypothetical protein GUITHDRAFT_140239 [Guillardia theta CCMP2712]